VKTSRLYRLELEDGRAGQVVVTRVASQNDQEMIVDFEHAPHKPR
jgi:hypothetical protein